MYTYCIHNFLNKLHVQQCTTLLLCISVSIHMAVEATPPPPDEEPPSTTISSPIRLTPERDQPTKYHGRVLSPDSSSRLHVKERLYLSKGDIGKWNR